MAELSRLAAVTPQTKHRLVVGMERCGFLIVDRRHPGQIKTLPGPAAASAYPGLPCAVSRGRHQP
jgi:hypothetical protein